LRPEELEHDAGELLRLLEEGEVAGARPIQTLAARLQERRPRLSARWPEAPNHAGADTDGP
jgi:hypothetical protein